MSGLDSLTIKIKHNENPEGLIESSLMAIKYLKLHSNIITDIIFNQLDVDFNSEDKSENKKDEIDSEYFIFSESLDNSTIDDLIVFAQRWEGYVKKMLSDLNSNNLMKTKPFSQMEEVTKVYSGLHSSVAAMRVSALKSTVEFLTKLYKIMFMILDKIQKDREIPDSVYENIKNKVFNETDDRKIQEVDTNLEERGVSLGWGGDNNEGEEK